VHADAAYSDLKAAWDIDRIAALRRGEQVVPSQIQLILSDTCNQDCGFCSYRMSTGLSSEQFVEHIPGGGVNRNPQRMIPYEKALEILEDAAEAGVHAVQFTGGGEPTVHPRHLDLFARALDLGLACGLVSNGLVLRPGWRDVLPRFEWIRISLDAGTADTYARTRVTKKEHFARVLANAAEIASACPKTLVGIGYTVTPENWEEIGEGVRRARLTGAAYVRISAMFSSEGEKPFAGIYRWIKMRIEAAREEHECSAFRVVDLFGDRIADLKQLAPDYSFCGYQQMNMYIGGDLKVYRCCTTAYTKHGEVGDLKNQSFAEFLASSAKQEKYASFDARSCSTCQFNGKNRVLNYMVDPKPLHVRFV